MMLSELGEAGAWCRVFNEPNLRKFDEPTVVGVDFPRLGIATAWNDLADGALHVGTYAAATAATGSVTSFSVQQVPDPAAVTISCDGAEFNAWRTVGPDSIEITTDVGAHTFRIATGYHGTATGTGAGVTAAGVTATTKYQADCGGNPTCCS